MSAEELLRHLQARPFQPFRVCLTVGEGYEVRHPEMVLPGEEIAEIGLPNNPALPIAGRIVTIALAHIVRLVPLPVSAATGNRPAS